MTRPTDPSPDPPTAPAFHQSYAFEIVGSTEKLDAFIDLMAPLGLCEVSRTGVVAIARGVDTL